MKLYYVGNIDMSPKEIIRKEKPYLYLSDAELNKYTQSKERKYMQKLIVVNLDESQFIGEEI